MSDQLGFPGFELSAPTDRLFFGIYPPDAVAERIAALAAGARERHGFRSRPHATERLHITLHLVGDFAGSLPPDKRAQAAAAGDGLRAAPFDVTFDHAASFSSQPRNRPFVLRGGEGVGDLVTMRQALSLELMKAGLPKVANTGFTPHVTLLYDDKAAPPEPIDPITWTVNEFRLVHSLLGRSQHIPLRTWPLVG